MLTTPGTPAKPSMPPPPGIGCRGGVEQGQQELEAHLIIVRTTQFQGLALEVNAVECHRLKKKFWLPEGLGQ